MHEQQKLWLLQLSQLLIEQYHCTPIEVRDISDERWFSDTSGDVHRVIRLSIKDDSALESVKERNRKIKEAVESVIQRPTEFWNIYLNPKQSDDQENEEGTEIKLSPNTICDQFLEAYPAAKKVLIQTDDPEKEMQSFVRQQREKARKQSSFWNRLKHLPKTTAFVLSLITLVFAGVSLLQVFEVDPVVSSIVFGAYYRPFILGAFEFWRFLTSGFVHIEFWHFLMNAMSLFNIGSFMERIYDWKSMLVTLLAGIVFGNLFAFTFSDATLIVGLSGGLYALMGLLVMYLFESGLYRQPRVISQFSTMILMNLLINFMPGVSFLSHLGGFIAGMLCALIFARKESWLHLKKHGKGAMLALFVLLIALGMNPRVSEKVYPGTDWMVMDFFRKVKLDFYADFLQNRLTVYYERVTS